MLLLLTSKVACCAHCWCSNARAASAQMVVLPALQLACCASAKKLSLDSSSHSCLQMELRYNEVDKARNIYERYVRCLPTVKAWVRYAKFEMQNGQVGLARRCYERAIEQLGEDAQTVWPDSAERLTWDALWGHSGVHLSLLLLGSRNDMLCPAGSLCCAIVACTKCHCTLQGISCGVMVPLQTDF